MLTPALVPPMTFAMGLHMVFIKLSLADTVAGVVLILALFSYPYMFRALVAGFQTMGKGYRICARNLGAGPVVVFCQVELPLLVPAMIAGGSVVFLVAFSEYFLVFLMGGGHGTFLYRISDAFALLLQPIPGRYPDPDLSAAAHSPVFCSGLGPDAQLPEKRDGLKPPPLAFHAHGIDEFCSYLLMKTMRYT